MIKLSINNKSYKVATSWAEVSNDQLLPMESPEILKKIYNAEPKKAAELIKGLTVEQMENELPAFYIQALAMFSNIPIKVLEQTDTGQVITLYQNTIEPLIYDLVTLKFTSHQPRHRKGFKRSMFLNDTEIPAYDLQAVQFCEATDLMTAAKDDPRLLRMIPEIYKQKQFDEKQILKRGGKPLKMDVVLDFFFIICKCFHLFRKNTARYSSQGANAHPWRRWELRGLCMN